jgi:hypothetical protein
MKCARQDNHCRRSVIYDADHLCEECHKQAAEMFGANKTGEEIQNERPAPEKKQGDPHPAPPHTTTQLDTTMVLKRESIP